MLGLAARGAGDLGEWHPSILSGDCLCTDRQPTSIWVRGPFVRFLSRGGGGENVESASPIPPRVCNGEFPASCSRTELRARAQRVTRFRPSGIPHGGGDRQWEPRSDDEGGAGSEARREAYGHAEDQDVPVVRRPGRRGRELLYLGVRRKAWGITRELQDPGGRAVRRGGTGEGRDGHDGGLPAGGPGVHGPERRPRIQVHRSRLALRELRVPGGGGRAVVQAV